VSFVDPKGTVVDFFWESRSMKASGDLDLDISVEATPISLGFGLGVKSLGLKFDIHLYRYIPSTETHSTGFTVGLIDAFHNIDVGFSIEYSKTNESYKFF
jgi:hypothetical protein